MPHKTSEQDNGAPATIRVATEADHARLIPLINSAFAVETFLEGTRTDDERLAALMGKGQILVMEDLGGQLAASVYTEVRGSRGYLGMLAVDPAHQGNGLARAIVSAAEEHLRQQGCEGVDITVLSLRPELPPIYRRFGYVQTGTEEPRLAQRLKAGEECHCIVMSKQL